RPKRAAGHCHPTHLQVRHEPPVDPVLGVTDVVSVLRLFAANRATLGHEAPSDWDDGKWSPNEYKIPAGRLELYHGLSMASKTPTALGQSRQWGRVEVFP